MRRSFLETVHRMVDGSIRVFLAEALYVPTALVTAAFLTRRLGPEGYGLFILAATLVAWVESSISSLFTHATVKFVGEAKDWRLVGATAARLHLAVSGIAALLLWFLAVPIARLLSEPMLAPYLCLFALDIPLFSLARAHRNILVGIGGFKQRAVTSAGRWTARMVLIVLLVELGLSVPGAILGSIGASLVELVISRSYVRPSVFRQSGFPARPLFGYAVPLFLFALSLSFYNKLDLLALKALGASAAQAGIYGAAQNFTLARGIFIISFSPLLLSTLGRTLRAGDGPGARKIGRHAMRVVIGLLPVAGMIAGAAPEIVGLIFGPAFLPAAPLLALLIFGAVALTMISVATTILTAAGMPRWAFALTGPLVPLAIGGHLLLIPRLGAIGASLVTTLLAGFGALAAVLAVHSIWRILPPLATVLRSALVCGLAYALAALWPAPGFLPLFLKLTAIGLMIPFSFLLLGEINATEIDLIRSMLQQPRTAAQQTSYRA